MSRFHHHILGLIVFAFIFVGGCDSTTTTRADVELIIGSWLGTDIRAELIGPLPSVSIPGVDASVASATFGSSNAFSFLFDPEDNAELSIPQTSVSIPLPDQVMLSGTFALNETAKTIALTREGIPGALQLEYRFRGDDDLEITANTPEGFAALLGLASADAELLATVITGGSIRFDRE